MVNRAFFQSKKPLKIETTEEKPILINMTPFGIYAAIAAAFVNNFFSKPSKIFPSSLMEKYKESFPNKNAHLKDEEKIRHYLATPRSIVHFINNLAHVLKEIRDQKLQKEGKEYVAENKIAPIANALSYPIEVKKTTSNKTIFSREHYGPKEKNLKPLILQKHNDQIFLEVNTSLRSLEAYLMTFFEKNHFLDSQDKPEVIAESIKNEYEKNKQRLILMLHDEKDLLDETTLMSIYIKSFNKSFYPGLEHGCQNFFENFEKKSPSVEVSSTLHTLLILAISRALSINQLDWEDITTFISQLSSDKGEPKSGYAFKN